MKREITMLERDALRKDNNKKLFVDVFGDAVFTTLTCEAASSFAYSGHEDIKLFLLGLSVFGAYLYYRDTLQRVDESLYLDNNYTSMYDREDSVRLIKRNY